jgi:hypothetical protein
MSITPVGEIKEVFSPYSRLTSRIPSDVYYRVRGVVISILSDHGEVTMNQLLELAEQKLANEFKERTTWYVLKIKLDMEARKEIRIKKPNPPTALPVLKLRHNVRL